MNSMSTTSSTRRRAELLSAEEEVELAKQIEAGLYAEYLLAQGDRRFDPRLLREVAGQGRAAFTRFVEANQRLAAWWARRRIAAGGAGGMTLEDLTSEGVLGVVRAVCKFDYTLGFKFSTYATDWVRVFQQRAVLRLAPTKLSARDRHLAEEVLAAEQDLTSELRRTPTAAEVAARVGTTVKAVALVHDMLRRPAALDQTVTADGSATYADLLAATDPGEDHGEEDVAALLAALPPREKAVVIEAFGLAGRPARTVADLARAHRLPPEAIETVLGTAIGRMRWAATGMESAA